MCDCLKRQKGGNERRQETYKHTVGSSLKASTDPTVNTLPGLYILPKSVLYMLKFMGGSFPILWF